MILGKPNGLFDLNESDNCVGSYISRQDIKEILRVDDNDLQNIKFIRFGEFDYVDERILQKHWYSNEIPNAIRDKKSSLDEFLLIAIINKTFPEIIVEQQIRVKRYSMDLKLTLGTKSIFIEFDGPSHFTITKYGMPKEPFLKKKIVEDATGIEVVNWAYWIQRCSSNVKVLFDKNATGFGVLWSTEVHFGHFIFENSAQIIENISNRFNAIDKNGFGYFYGANTKNRNNPEHPIIDKIKNGKVKIDTLLPKGFIDTNYWLPDKLKIDY